MPEDSFDIETASQPLVNQKPEPDRKEIVNPVIEQQRQRIAELQKEIQALSVAHNPQEATPADWAAEQEKAAKFRIFLAAVEGAFANGVFDMNDLSRERNDGVVKRATHIAGVSTFLFNAAKNAGLVN